MKSYHLQQYVESVMLSEIRQLEKDKYNMMWNLRTKETNQIKTHSWTQKETDGCQREGGLGTTVGNIVITMCGARWVLERLRGILVKYMIV